VIFLVASLAVVACALLIPPRYRPRHREPSGHVRGPQFGDPRVVRIVAAACGVVFAFLWGGWFGVLSGIGIAIAVPVLIGRLESRADRQRREALQAQSAVSADLLAACLLSGAPTVRAVRAVGDAMDSPVAEHLRALASALDLGASPAVAWQSFGAESALAPIARVAARSSDTGAPLAPLLVGVADDLRRSERSRGEAAARAAGVRAVGPLAACFLPAFVLLGVVPVVVSLAAPLLAR